MGDVLSSEIRVPLPDGKDMKAALALPDSPGPHPGVVVLHEAFGLNDDIRRIGRRFADEGYVALAFAVRGSVRAAAVNYGAVPKDAAKLEGVCPVVASYGGRDRLMGKLGDRLERHLTQLGVAHDVKTYPDVGHSFLGQHDSFVMRLPNPMATGYSEQEAEDAWKRILAFFAEHVQKGAA